VRSWTKKFSPSFSRTSTTTEWEERGELFFQQEQYQNAEFCFQRAKLFTRVTETQAYGRRYLARCTPPSRARNNSFREAASLFKKFAAGQSEITARLEPLYHAAECLKDASEFDDAVKTYLSAKRFSEAVILAADRSWYDRAVTLIHKHRKELDNQDHKTAKKVLYRAKLYYAMNEDFG
jgi:tetratricopeptide (TPR) repeat protein